MEGFFGYPITPASDVLHELSRHKNFGVKTFQAEDEIAAAADKAGLTDWLNSTPDGLDTQEVLDELQIATGDEVTVTIPEGLRAEEVAGILAARGVVDRDAFLERLREHHRLPLRVPRHLANRLVFVVVSAIRIAVTEEDLLAVQFDDAGVLEDGDARFPGERLPDHEVTVAVHEEHGHAAV